MFAYRDPPRVVEGEAISGSAWNGLIDAIRAARVIGVDGLEATQTAAGLLLRADRPRESRWFRVTTALTAATDSGTVVTLGVGAGNPQATVVGSASPPAPTLVDDGATTPTTLYNGLNGTIAAGKIVLCEPVDGLWIVTIAWC